MWKKRNDIARIGNWNKISRADMQWWPSHHLTDRACVRKRERGCAFTVIIHMFTYYKWNFIILLLPFFQPNHMLSMQRKKYWNNKKRHTHARNECRFAWDGVERCLCTHISFGMSSITISIRHILYIFNDSSLLFARIIWSRLQNCRKKRALENCKQRQQQKKHYYA